MDRKSFFGGVSGLTLAFARDDVEEGVDIRVLVSAISLVFAEPLVSGNVSLSGLFRVIVPDENPGGRPPTLRGLARPPGGGDRIRPPMLTSRLELVVGLRTRSALVFCFALLISDIHAGC